MGFAIVEVDTDPFSRDRDRLVAAHFAQSAVAATTYYVFIDLDGASYKHDTSGTAIKLFQVVSQAAKTKSSAVWSVQLAVILTIDGTDADLGFLPVGNVNLKKSNKFRIDGQVDNLFPHRLDLTVSGGDFEEVASGFKETAVTAVNTGITLADVFGVSVTPAVGDLLLRAELVSGSGTLEFAYGLQYFVE